MAIYLGESSHIDWETMEFSIILKIGYTEDNNLSKRMNMYSGHNRSFRLIKTIQEGNEEHESKLLYKFRKYKKSGREWFEDVPEIREFFKNCTLEDIDKIKLPKKENISKLEIRYPKIEISLDWDLKVQEFFREWNTAPTVYMERVKMICEFIFSNPELKEAIINNLADSDKIKQQLIVVGPERIASLGYNLTRINKEMGIVIFDRETLNVVIYNEFKIGEKYPNKYIKDLLGQIYKACDFQGTAKANHLEEWFNIKKCKVPIEDGTRVDGLEILSVKQQ